jgi:hypothetical protein
MAVIAAPSSGSLDDADLAELPHCSPSADETAALPHGSRSTNKLAALTANSISRNPTEAGKKSSEEMGNGGRREKKWCFLSSSVRLIL